MPIQNVGSLNSVLNNYSSKEWTKSADVELQGMGEFKNLLGSDPFKANDNRKSFSEMLSGSITEVNGLQKEANVAIEKLVTGKSKNLHETMLAVEKAEIAFKTMNQIRMKVIDAYKEVMRMQV